MLSRRRFLGLSGMGVLALSSACRPPMFDRAVFAGQSPDARLSDKESLKSLKDHLLGYPINMRTPPNDFFQWRAELLEAGIDQFAFNNVGNPFKPSPIPYNTHDFERDTIQTYGRLFGFPASNIWGFISHSGTDSNMHGMYMGRTLLTGRTGVVPKAYFTHEAHYSVQILRDLLGLQAEVIGTLPDGSLDPHELASRLDKNTDAPALVVATIGTTFKGAIDNIDQIRSVLGHRPSYVHLDAALFGGYLPFTPHADVVSWEGLPQGRYDSIAVSCHKFFGFPSPAGLFVTTRRLYDEFNELFGRIHNPEYIHQVPGTITCSRDAVKPAEFFYFTRPTAMSTLRTDAGAMLDNAAELHEQLQSQFPQLGAIRSNPLSNTVYFRSPGEAVINKYSLATMQLGHGANAPRYAHVVVMPHVTREVIGEFLEDVKHAMAA